MAIIEKNTRDSIIRNGYLIDSLSRERIWDEIKKSFSQSKKFNEYLNYLSEFDLFKYVFPGADINTELVDSKDFIIVLANLFKKEKTAGLEKTLVQNFKIDIDKAKKIVFLLDFSNFNQPIEVFDLYKKKVASGVKDSTLLEWLKVTSNNSNILTRFIDYKPSVSSKPLIDKGFEGRSLGLEIKRQEIEIFINML